MCAKCPQCGKKIYNEKHPSPSNPCPTIFSRRGDGQRFPYFPFCSRKCKLADLEGWLGNRYKISSPLNTERSEDND